MTTALTEIVTRRTTFIVDGREVEVSLVPDAAGVPALSFHLVGLHEKSDKRIPLLLLLRVAGYKVKLPKTEGDHVFERILRGERVDMEEFTAACDELEAALRPQTQQGGP